MPEPPSIELLSASAGTGKTYRLTHTLAERLAGDGGRTPVRPEGVIATTFTRKAAAELAERGRRVLLEAGRADDAWRLGGGCIGTVNAVCGQLLARFCFEAGLSPQLEVLAEGDAPAVFREALSGVLDPATVDALHHIARAFDFEGARIQDAVREIVDAARANGIGPERLPESARRSLAELMAALPEEAPDGDALDAGLRRAIDAAIRAIERGDDGTKGTRKYLDYLQQARGQWHTRETLPWRHWVKLSKAVPCRPSIPRALPVQRAAARHLEHPRLRTHLRQWIATIFELAGRALTAYQVWKEERRLVDFVDQEAGALRLLDLEPVRERIAEDLDLLLVDEFQDTSPIQLALFLRLSRLARASVWVGDPKQTVFAFRGADPALMEAVLRRLPPSEVLDQCRRSRPALVHLASELFADRFLPHIRPQQVRTEPVRDEPAGLPAPLHVWRLASTKAEEDAEAIASGIARLLGRSGGRVARIQNPATAAIEPARPGDVAVLCRDNAGCGRIAAALERRGIRAAVRREGLMSTPEAVLVRAALRRLLDDRDSLATAEIVALTATDPAPEGWLADRIRHVQGGRPSREWAADHSIVRAIDELRPRVGALSPSETLDAVLEAADLRRWILGWGRGAFRLGNVEALRRMAAEYQEQCAHRRAAATPAGLLGAYAASVEEETDLQAEGTGAEAVHVLTYHRAKGLEWPVVVLTQLDWAPEGRVWELSVMDDRAEIDIDRPLAGRWLRCWPWPYGAQEVGTGLAERDAIRTAQEEALRRARAEELRLLYVGMTRARDVLVWAVRRIAKTGALSAEWLDAVVAPEGAARLDLVGRPGRKTQTVRGTGRTIEVDVQDVAPEGIDVPAPGATPWPAVPPGARPHLPARILASDGLPLEGKVARCGRVVEVGARLTISGNPELGRLGDALHGFFAVEGGLADEDERRRVAAELLQRHGVAGAIDTEALSDRARALRRALEELYPGAATRTEWPVQARIGQQTLVGWADLVLDTAAGWVVVDHKSYPGRREEWAARALEHAGQLAAYARALGQATGRPVVGTWIHFSVGGGLVEVSWVSGL